MIKRFFNQFLQLEAIEGIILFVSALFAVLIANSVFAPLYQLAVAKSSFLINEIGMVLFFLLVGCELKRGFLTGELSRFSQIALPLAGALGGMVVPPVIYLLITRFDPLLAHGWAIPVATDIAFALGVLLLFGKRIPPALKLFLLALAIFDDLGAILIIALFYSKGIVWFHLLGAFAVLAGLFLLNVRRVSAFIPYSVLGVLLWYFIYAAHIHPTIAGVLFALLLPAPLLNRIETGLHPYVAFGIMPLFALANAGFTLSASQPFWHEPLVLGIILALILGKPMGVLSAVWCMVRLSLATLPAGITWLSMSGVAILCGIGFTMSLFLGTLSFTEGSLYLALIRKGVIYGSLCSALMGIVVLSLAFRNTKKESLL